ncbi:MAG: hypothetical protein ACOX6G_05820 [Christensenellales bacterium]|jgi:hypothetical protein|nr:hypothetical protein [Clostridiales bacterium]
MNQLSNWLLSLLFGWTGLLANGILDLFSKDQGMISRIFEHTWFILFIAIVVIGTIIDQIVWFARWQPHKIRKYEKQAQENMTSTGFATLDQEMDSYADFYAYQHQYDEQPFENEQIYIDNTAYPDEPVETYIPQNTTIQVEWYPSFPDQQIDSFYPYELPVYPQEVQGDFVPMPPYPPIQGNENLVANDSFAPPINEDYHPPLIEPEIVYPVDPQPEEPSNQQPVRRRRTSPSDQ